METPQINLLAHAMQAYAMRMRASASNIANLDTPGYRRRAVNFEEALQNTRHQVPGMRDELDVEPKTEVQDAAPVLEDELMDLADTQMRTQFASRALRDHFGMIRSSITGRTG